MFVDASALVAILVREPGFEALIEQITQAASRVTSPLAVWETTVAVLRVRGGDPKVALELVETYLALTGIEVREIPAAARFTALDAFARYGKGRHPAGLNFGDCFAYACARLAGEPLLCKGDDFAQTDIARV